MKILSVLNAKIKRWKDEQEKRENRKLAHLKTKEARDKERAQIYKARLKREKEIAEAKAATRRAQLAAVKVGKELREINPGLASQIGRYFSGRRKVRRRTRQHAKK